MNNVTVDELVNILKEVIYILINMHNHINKEEFEYKIKEVDSLNSVNKEEIKFTFEVVEDEVWWEWISLILK